MECGRREERGGGRWLTTAVGVKLRGRVDGWVGECLVRAVTLVKYIPDVEKKDLVVAPADFGVARVVCVLGLRSPSTFLPRVHAARHTSSLLFEHLVVVFSHGWFWPVFRKPGLEVTQLGVGAC